MSLNSLLSPERMHRASLLSLHLNQTHIGGQVRIVILLSIHPSIHYTQVEAILG